MKKNKRKNKIKKRSELAIALQSPIFHNKIINNKKYKTKIKLANNSINEV